jgi:hypothetical protein
MRVPTAAGIEAFAIFDWRFAIVRTARAVNRQIGKPIGIDLRFLIGDF